MTADEARLLYAYNRWANERVLQAVSGLSGDQLQRDLSGSFRSLWQTLVHVVWGEWLWLGRWVEWAQGPGSDPRDCGDLATLRVRWTTLMDQQHNFLGHLTDSRLEDRLSYENPPGVPWTYLLSHMLQHVVNHSTYHRGQVATMLRQLGVAALPTDFLVYLDERRKSNGGTSIAGA